jgi:hypothetical protein
MSGAVTSMTSITGISPAAATGATSSCTDAAAPVIRVMIMSPLMPRYHAGTPRVGNTKK